MRRMTNCTSWQVGWMKQRFWRGGLSLGFTAFLVGCETTQPETIYEKFLRVRAHEREGLNLPDSANELWSVTVKKVDQSVDLKENFPLMTEAAILYIGENTGGMVEVKMR